MRCYRFGPCASASPGHPGRWMGPGEVFRQPVQTRTRKPPDSITVSISTAGRLGSDIGGLQDKL
jgi:hypothetical protein